MSDDKPRGRFVWHDLMTSDPEAAQTFYTQVLGWGTEIWEGAGQPYVMWMRGENQGIGGIMTLPPSAGAPPHWLAYVSVPDVDATAARAAELGGQVRMAPTDIPTVGRFAVIVDPQGAQIALFTAAGQTPGHDDTPQVGEFSWHELATTDAAAAVGFYADLFAWESMADHDMGPMGVYRIFGRQGQQLGGMFDQPAEMPGPPAWLPYVRVADVDAAAQRVKDAGGQVLNGPMEVPGGDWIAQCSDPQGGMFAVHGSKSA